MLWGVYQLKNARSSRDKTKKSKNATIHRGPRMIARRFRAFAYTFLFSLTFPALHADVTLRYKTESKMNPGLPAMISGPMLGSDFAKPQETALRLKGGKGFSTAAAYNSITDFTTQEVTLLDAPNAHYAKIKASELGALTAAAMPKIPDQVGAMMASMKFDVSPARVTGRSAVIQDVDTEEREIAISISGPALPGMPPGPMVRVVMQMWTAKSGEVLRVPAIRELTGYALWSWATMNPVAGMSDIIKQLPGLATNLESMMSEMQKGTTMLRLHTDMFMPGMVAILQQMPGAAAGFDANAPFMQMDQEAVELSSAPVPDSFFQIPEGFQATPAADLFKGVFAKSQAAVKQ